MAKTGTRQTKKHHRGYFSRQPKGWNIQEFVRKTFDQRVKHDKSAAESIAASQSLDRTILTSWRRNLKNISECQNKKCCSKSRRDRAEELLRVFSKKGDKSTAKNLLRSLREAEAQSFQRPTVNVESLILNNGIYAHDLEGEQTLVQFPGESSQHPNINLNLNPATSHPNIPPGAPPTARTCRATTPGTDEDIDNSSINSCTEEEDDDDDDDDDFGGTDEEDEEEEREEEQGAEEASAKVKIGKADKSDLSFQRIYASFSPTRKWKLPSGSTVEDVLHAAYTHTNNKTGKNNTLGASARESIRNWIVDLGNTSIQALFSEKDWKAIRAEVTPLPEQEQVFVEYIARFINVITVEELRKVLEAALLEKSARATRDFDLEWVERVLWHFLVLYEHNTLNRTQCLERWYDYNIWSRIIDDSFLSIPNVILDRCELNSQSYLRRKNHNRTEIASRMKSGPRLDGILRDYPGRTYEFCVVESAPALRGGVISTKWLSDKAKVQRTLRDMIRSLDLEVTRHGTHASPPPTTGNLGSSSGQSSRIPQKIEVFGISTAGLTLQVSRMSHTYKKGYVCLFEVEEALEIPNDVNQFQKLLLFLGGFVRIKHALAKSVDNFQKRGSSITDVEHFKQQLSKLFERTEGGSLPPIADSP